ncbi:MAG: hypothetical protein AAGI44_00320 [Pseudomonadota bacterium]
MRLIAKLPCEIVFALTIVYASAAGGGADAESERGEQEGKNLVENAGFNENLDGWYSKYNPGDFWQTNRDGDSELGALAVQTKMPEIVEEGYGYASESSYCAHLGNGSHYQFSASFKSSGQEVPQDANRLNLYWCRSSDCVSFCTFDVDLRPDPDKLDWQRLERVDPKRNLGAKTARIEVWQSQTDSNSTMALWDDISLRPIEFTDTETAEIDDQYTLPFGVNYLKNASFESDLSHWTYSDTISWTGSEGYDGEGAARAAMFSDRGYHGRSNYLGQCVNLGNNRHFSLSAKVRLSTDYAQSGAGYFRVYWYGDENCEGRGGGGFYEDRIEPETAGWQLLKIESITAPEEAHSAKISIRGGATPGGTLNYIIDDLSFTAIE